MKIYMESNFSCYFQKFKKEKQKKETEERKKQKKETKQETKRTRKSKWITFSQNLVEVYDIVPQL